MTKNRNLSQSEFPEGHTPDMVDTFGGPQMGQSENSQGTLWDQRKSNAYYRTGNEVGHKGFSKTRLDTVRSRIMSLARPDETNSWSLRGRQAVVGALDRGDATGRSMTQEGFRDLGKRATDIDVHEAVARSGIPSSHLEDLGIQPVAVEDYGPDSPAAGRFIPMDQGHGIVSLGTTHVNHPRAVTHEMGHARDWSQTVKRGEEVPGEATGMPITHVMEHTHDLAAAEGFADAYADKFTTTSGVPKTFPEAYNTSAYIEFRDPHWQEYASNNPNNDPASAIGASHEYRESRARHGGFDFTKPRPPETEQLSLFPEIK